MLCTLYMLIAGFVWTYAIGSVAAIMTTFNPNQLLHETTMDQLVCELLPSSHPVPSPACAATLGVSTSHYVHITWIWTCHAPCVMCARAGVLCLRCVL